MRGTIKRMMLDRGFGFIREENGQREWFFHRSACEVASPFSHFREGDPVEFEEDWERGEKGPRAKEVRRA